MKKVKILLFIAAGLMIAFSSCEDFLDREPHSSISNELAFETIEDFEVGINGVYSGFLSSSYYGKSYILLGDIMTDNVLARQGYSNTYGTMYHWDYNSGTYEPRNFWAAAYRVITRASNIIERIAPFEEGDDAEIAQNIKGEALLARAIAHFDLARLFAAPYRESSAATDMGIPVITVSEVGYPSRNTLEETYEQIIQDATDARELITETSSRTRFTKSTADAFLARVYLSMQNWDLAIDHATNVIDNTFYSIAEGEDYEAMWVYDTSDEIIWKLGLIPSEASSAIALGANYVNDGSGAPIPDYVAPNAFLDLYDDKDDQRYQLFYRHNEEVQDAGVFSLINKYPSNPELMQNGVNMPKVFRLSEMYLIRAEASAEDLDEDGANADLEYIRERRIDSYTHETLSGDALKEAIFLERRLELAYEGHYWWDLKRTNRGFFRSSQANTLGNDVSAESTNYRWLWPIPQEEILANPNIKDQQNPGYSN